MIEHHNRRRAVVVCTGIREIIYTRVLCVDSTSAVLRVVCALVYMYTVLVRSEFAHLLYIG